MADDLSDDGGELASLRPAEREVLAVLVAVGGAPLSPDRIGTLGEIDDVEPLVAELERRGLLTRDDRGRRLPAAGLMPQLRRALEVADTADRVLQHFISIAEDGRLTLDDLDAVLGISGWAAEAGRLTELLELVQAVETAISATRRVDAWLQLVGRAREAARELRDPRAEAWADERVRACERAIARTDPAGRVAEAALTTTARRFEQPAQPSVARMGLAAVTVVAAAGLGFAFATVLGGEEGEAGPTVTLPGGTVTAPDETITLEGATVTTGGETVTLGGATVTLTGETVTLPAETVTLPGTEVTTTVFVTPGPG